VVLVILTQADPPGRVVGVVDHVDVPGLGDIGMAVVVGASEVGGQDGIEG
jgi:hypothetical protein